MKKIYLDNAATTQVKKEVLDAMLPYFMKNYGNPSASYSFAKEGKRAIDKARTQIAELIHCSSEEIYFTSGGTESDNWAIKSIALANGGKGKHIISTKIEHHAVLHTLTWLETQGFEVTLVGVGEDGIVKAEDIEKAIRPDTILISVMTANNEIGTIQPIKEIGAIARKNKILFHTDAVQAFGHIPIDVSKMKIDMLSASGHKIHGPKGVGILYARKGIKLTPLMHGGSQENGIRAGTYNVPGIVGMGRAAEMARENLGEQSEIECRNYFLKRILYEISNSSLNGDIENRLPNNINVEFEGVDAEALLVMLENNGIFASAGSACTTGMIEPSHVLISLGLSELQAKSSIRLTISKETSKQDIDFAVEVIKKSIERLRKKHI